MNLQRDNVGNQRRDRLLPTVRSNGAPRRPTPSGPGDGLVRCICLVTGNRRQGLCPERRGCEGTEVRQTGTSCSCPFPSELPGLSISAGPEGRPNWSVRECVPVSHRRLHREAVESDHRAWYSLPKFVWSSSPGCTGWSRTLGKGNRSGTRYPSAGRTSRTQCEQICLRSALPAGRSPDLQSGQVTRNSRS